MAHRLMQAVNSARFLVIQPLASHALKAPQTPPSISVGDKKFETVETGLKSHPNQGQDGTASRFVRLNE